MQQKGIQSLSDPRVQAFIQANPQSALAQRMGGGAQSPGAMGQGIPNISSGPEGLARARQQIIDAGGNPDMILSASSTGGRMQIGNPLGTPGTPGYQGPQSFAQPGQIPGAGPNVQKLAQQGVDPNLIQQRLRAMQQQPGIVPPVTM